MDRKYQATRIKAGDYLVPSNDAAHIWRISSYQDTGARIEMRSKDAGVLMLNPPARTRWQAHRYRLTVAQLDALGDELPADFLDWDQWQYDSGDYPSKAAAIKAALKQSEKEALANHLDDVFPGFKREMG